MARYGDSRQQTGVNIGNNSATPPRNIEISSMTFQTVETTDIFLVEDATQCYFDSVNFAGPLTQADIISNAAADDIAGVRFASTSTLVCNQVTFDKCGFSGLSYGINTDQQIESVTVSNSKFDTLYQGIVLGTGSVVNGGATGFRAIHNMFDTVYAEGVVYDAVNLNTTAYNVFYDVGNEFDSNYTSSPVVLFGNDNNTSICDMFERIDTYALTQPRVKITGGSTTTGTQLQIGRYARENGRTFLLSNNVSSAATVFTTNVTTVKAYQMNYTIVRDTAVRYGVLTVTAQNSDDSSLNLSYNDDYTENLGTGVTLAVTQSGDVVSVTYSTTNTGLTGTLTYSLNYLA